MNQAAYFFDMRAKLALEHVPTEDRIHSQRLIDQQANPHNDPYPKRPRRDTAQIISDLKFNYADQVLLHQFGEVYRDWLRRHCKEVWGLLVLQPQRSSSWNRVRSTMKLHFDWSVYVPASIGFFLATVLAATTHPILSAPVVYPALMFLFLGPLLAVISGTVNHKWGKK